MGGSTCSSCGQALRPGVRVCTNCGVPVASAAPTGPLASQQPSQGGVATAPSRAYAPQPPRTPTEPHGVSGGPQKVIRLKAGHVAFVSILVALIFVGAIAAGAMTPADEPPGQLVGQLPFDEDGGTRSFDDGAGKIEVPRGALDGPQTIEVRRTPVRDRVMASSPSGTQLVFPPGALVAYIFGPVSITFDRPVTITLRLPVADESGLVFVTTGGDIRFYSGTVSGRTISITLNSFDLSTPGAVVSG